MVDGSALARRVQQEETDSMRIRVDLLPRDDYAGELVVLVDVLRAATVAATLFDGRLAELSATASLRESRRVAEGGRVLIGEREGLPPEGFNHTSSPSLLRAIDFTGCAAVLLSENAPRALAKVAPSASGVLLASFYNASAVIGTVTSLAPERVSIVCSGYQDQEDLDDTVAAGFLVGSLAARVEGDVTLEGAARLAMGLVQAFPEPLEALWLSAAGRQLRRHQAHQELAVASQISQSASVPRLVAREPGRHAPVFLFRLAPGNS